MTKLYENIHCNPELDSNSNPVFNSLFILAPPSHFHSFLPNKQQNHIQI